MTFSTGLIVVIVAMAFFYLRIAFLRGRKKRYERDFATKTPKGKRTIKRCCITSATQKEHLLTVSPVGIW